MERLIDADEAYKVPTDYYHHKTEIQHKALKEAIERVPIADIDAITESHERIGYDRGFSDGYAQATSEHPLEWAVSQSVINSMPTVSQHVESVGEDGSALKHGHWILSEDRYWKTCSECGAEVDVSMGLGIFVDNIEVDEMNYCPICGAYMGEETE